MAGQSPDSIGSDLRLCLKLRVFEPFGRSRASERLVENPNGAGEMKLVIKDRVGV
jgi:hypothetical protein